MNILVIVVVAMVILAIAFFIASPEARKMFSKKKPAPAPLPEPSLPEPSMFETLMTSLQNNVDHSKKESIRLQEITKGFVGDINQFKSLTSKAPDHMEKLITVQKYDHTLNCRMVLKPIKGRRAGTKVNFPLDPDNRENFKTEIVQGEVVNTGVWVVRLYIEDQMVRRHKFDHEQDMLNGMAGIEQMLVDIATERIDRKKPLDEKLELVGFTKIAE